MSAKTKLILLIVAVIIVIALVIWEPMISVLVVMIGISKMIWDKVKHIPVGTIKKKK